jgi:DNA gyrase subunit B
MTDADVDGAHINTLLLTFFFRYFRPLLEEGHVFLAQPPLYKVKKGKEVFYYYSEEEKIAAIGTDMPETSEEGGEEETGVEEAEQLTLTGSNKDKKDKKSDKVEIKKEKISVQRYKGLGEMNAEELGETTMDPAHRILKQVTIEDAQDADKIFDMLMGNDVPSRKSFIQSNAKLASLDI